MDSAPLVSICTTFWNAERYIGRVFESCINQTYGNIEIVVVDDASTDQSERIVREYMARDRRINYVRNAERTGLTESELQMFKLAKGEFTMMLGADDWLSKDYIENGVRSFLAHPDAAGVIPDLTTLFEYGDKGIFTFQRRLRFPQGVRSAEWFMRRMYRPAHLYISAYALVRTEDFVSALEYYIKNYYRNPSDSLPEELRGFFRRAFGMDVMTFPKILTRHKSFVFDGSLNYIKISHSSNQQFDLRRDSLAAIFKDAYFNLLLYAYIYKSKWPEFYGGMKIFRGAEALATALIKFIRSGSRLKLRGSREFVREFFRDFSLLEIAASALYSVPMVMRRFFRFAIRKLAEGKNREDEERSVFVEKNFLDPERRFRIR